MSREIRRVPVGWKHPTEPNPYWREQTIRRLSQGRGLPRLHAPEVRFVPLFEMSVSKAREEWLRERDQWAAGTHSHLLWLLEYHSPDGYLNDNGERDKPVPCVVYADDGETVVREFYPTTVAEVTEVYPYSEYAGGEPDESTHMPDFEGPLGWCLYETVTEGTPVTPVFATAEELVDYLATVGSDWDDEPWRRTAAELMVAQGYSVGTFVSIGGEILRGANDLDRIRDLDRQESS